MTRKTRFKIKLPAFAKYMIYATVTSLLLTGLLLYATYTWEWLEINALSSVWVKIHAITGLIWLMLMGYIMSTHLPYTTKIKTYRVLGVGVMLLAILAFSVITGFGLYYIPYEWMETCKYLHFWGSLGFFVIFVVHIVLGRTRFKQKPH